MPLYPRRQNPAETYTTQLVQALHGMVGTVRDMAQGIPPAYMTRVDPQTALLLYDNPHARFLGQTNPDTGAPYTNAEAADFLHQNGVPGYEQAGGPASQFVAYVDDMEALKAKQGAAPEVTDG